MKNNTVFVSYYIYCIVIIGVFSYAVFILNRSGWWFALALILLSISPTIKTKNE